MYKWLNIARELKESLNILSYRNGSGLRALTAFLENPILLPALVSECSKLLLTLVSGYLVICWLLLDFIGSDLHVANAHIDIYA